MFLWIMRRILTWLPNIVMNGKVQRPGVCNALETLLVHEDIAPTFLPKVATELIAAGVELRGCPRTKDILPGVNDATEADWYAEFLDLILAVRVVADLDAAMDHIDTYGSQHTEVIVTADYANAQRFIKEVDASAVMVNASTRFSDGGQFGLGAEIGISTTKLHAYGPMGLKELTARKFIVYGDGQIRSLRVRNCNAWGAGLNCVQKRAEVKKIGLLGGTFDPVHNGHLAVAKHVLRVLALDSIWFIPAASPPHKSAHEDGREISSFTHRVAMLERAISHHSSYVISDIEAKRSAPSYSIDTINILLQQIGEQADLFFIIGADAFIEIDTWKRYKELPILAIL